MMISLRRAAAILVWCTAIAVAASCGHETSPASATGGASSPAAPSSPSADPRLPAGTYRTGTISLDRLIATGVAAGFNRPAVEKFYREQGVSVSAAFTIKLQSGRWTQFGAADGGRDEIWWAATYKVMDDSVIATDIANPSVVTFTYLFEGGELGLTVVSHNDGGVIAAEENRIAQVTIYQAAPFIKVG